MLHGARSYLLQDDNGQTIESHSISAGLDYPGVGPEHSYLHDIGRAEYRPVTDAEAMEAFALLCRTEGIIPAIESAHALAGALVLGKELGPDALLLVNLSGRGDKDVETASTWFGLGDREEVDPGPGLDTDQQPDRGRGHQRRGRGGPGRGGDGMSQLAERIGKAKAEGRAALIAYVPVGYPDVDGLDRGDGGRRRGRGRRRRDRRPLQRPGHGRPGHPAGGGRRRPRRASGMRDVLRAVEAVAAAGRRPGGDELLEPDRALRRRAVRRPTWPRPGERARSPPT